jgi:hypothetical protein
VRKSLAKAALFVVSKPRSVATTAMEVTGLGLIVAGFFRISLDSGLFAAGVALILIGVFEA